MGRYSIKELEKLSGIKAHTIRIWEQRYNLIKPHRTSTNIRFYDDEQLKHLLNISLLIKNGHKISSISELNKSQISNKILSIYTSNSIEHEQDDKVNALITAMIDLNEDVFDKIFSTSVIKLGFEETIVKLIYPFLEKVGIMWGINQINPAQEHFISCLIRQKIISATDGIINHSQRKKKYLLFLQEGEHHELGLLIANYILRNNGYKVYYLGQNVPSEDVLSIYKQIKPDVVLTFFITYTSIEDFASKFKKHCNMFAQSEFVFSGNSELCSSVKNTSKAKYLKSIADFKKLID